MEFFLKGLNPFKIQTRSKLEFVMNFSIQNPEGFGSWDEKEFCSIQNFLSPSQVWKFLER
jgi:hypothetical protein